MQLIYPKKEMINKIKIIVCDLDGTLYNNQKKVSKKTIDLLIELQKMGYTLILATGRYYEELQELIKALQLKKYHGYVICTNGVEIYDVYRNKLIHSFDYINYQEAVKIIQKARDHYIITYYNNHNCYHVIASPLFLKFIQFLKVILFPLHLCMHHYLIDGLYRLSFQSELDYVEKFHKLCFISSQKKIQNWVKYVQSWHKPYVFYSVNAKVTELVHESASKYEAVKYIVEKMDMSMSQVMSFGDSGNDLSLLKNSGIGIAMKNAQNDVFKETVYHSDYTNNEDGIYNYLKKVFDI